MYELSKKGGKKSSLWWSEYIGLIRMISLRYVAIALHFSPYLPSCAFGQRYWSVCIHTSYYIHEILLSQGMSYK